MMNRTVVLKNASGLAYDALADALNAAGIELSRSALAGRARAKTDKFLTDAEMVTFTEMLLNPTEDTQELVENVLSSWDCMKQIMSLYLPQVNADELGLGEDDDLSDLDLDGGIDDELIEPKPKKDKKSKKDKKKKSKGKKGKKSKDKKVQPEPKPEPKPEPEKAKKKDKKKSGKKSKKDKKSKGKKDNEADAWGDLEGAGGKPKKDKKNKKVKSDKKDPWSGEGDVMSNPKAASFTDPDSFEAGAGEEDDFDLDSLEI